MLTAPASSRAGSSVSARSCVVTRPRAPRPASARTIPSAPIRRSCELVPWRISSSRKSSGTGPRAASAMARIRRISAKKREWPACSESSMRSVAPTTSAEIRSRRAVTGAPARASTTLTPTDRSSVLFPDMFEPLTMITRGPPPPRRTSFLTPTVAAISGWPRPSASYSGPSSASSGNGSSGRSYAKVASAASASTSPTARSHSATAGPYAACHRSIAIASCWRSSRMTAIGANSMLCVESSHETSARSCAMRLEGGTPSVSSD